MGRKVEPKTKERTNVYLDIKLKTQLLALGESVNKGLSELLMEGARDLLERYSAQGVPDKQQAPEEPENTWILKERDFMLQPDGNSHNGITFVVTNNKGGVAKTTSCTAMAYVAAKKKHRVLVIDADMQGNASQLLGHAIDEEEQPNLAAYFAEYITAIEKKKPFPEVKDYILATDYKNMDVIIASSDLQGRLEDSVKEMNANYDNLMEILVNDIKKLNIYDFIFIDTQPSMNVFVTSSLFAADYALIPTDVDIQGIEGAIKLSDWIAQRSSRRRIAKVAGVFFTRADERTAMAKNIPAFKEQLKEMEINCFRTVISQCSDVPNSRANSKPVTVMYPAAKASKKYENLLGEVVEVIG